jgi:hypothetical protein
MPVPILPMNFKKDDDTREIVEQPDYMGINVDMLSGVIRTQQSQSNIKVSDSDASLLFKFWQEGKVTKQGSVESIEVPDKFSQNDILRLKALGFLVGDDTKVVKLTQRAKGVIKTIVLNEENRFESARVHKPYNEILAENNKKKSNIRLALEDKK